MTNNQKSAVVAVAITTFVGGYLLGDWRAVIRIRKTIKANMTLVENGLGSAFETAWENQLSREEFVALLHEELEFINIVTK